MKQTITLLILVVFYPQIALANDFAPILSNKIRELKCPTTSKEITILRNIMFRSKEPFSLEKCYWEERPKVSQEKPEFYAAKRCLENLKIYLSSFQDYKQENANEEMTSIPSALLNQDFLSDLVSAKKITEARKYLEKINLQRPENEKLIFAEFKASVEALNGGGFDRFIVYVPGNPRKWIAFALEENYSFKKMPANISVVSEFISKDKEVGLYFKDHQPQNKYMGLPEENVDCNKCHKRGPLAILPENFETNPDRKALFAINATMIPKNIDGDALTKGPAIGPDKERSDEFLDRCLSFQGNPWEGNNYLREINELKTKIEYGRVGGAYEALKYKLKEAMKCTSCHEEGKEAAKLNFKQAFWLDGGSTNIWRHIQTGSMPKNSKMPLNSLERKALINCLDYEYNEESGDGKPGLLKRWIDEESCEVSKKDIEMAEDFAAKKLLLETMRRNNKSINGESMQKKSVLQPAENSSLININDSVIAPQAGSCLESM